MAVTFCIYIGVTTRAAVNFPEIDELDIDPLLVFAWGTGPHKRLCAVRLLTFFANGEYKLD